MGVAGIGLKRDSVASVMYSEELHSAKSSVTLERTDRHELLKQKPADFQVSLWQPKQSVCQFAQQTGLSKSSVHRLQQAMERRNDHPESWCWETAAGRRWCTRLVVATLSLFGLKRGGGVETLRALWTRLGLATPVGCAPSA